MSLEALAAQDPQCLALPLFTRKLGAGTRPEHTEQARTCQVQQGWQIREPGESCMGEAEMEGTWQGQQVDGQPLQDDERHGGAFLLLEFSPIPVEQWAPCEKRGQALSAPQSAVVVQQ